MKKRYGIYLAALLAVCIIGVIVYLQGSTSEWNEQAVKAFADTYFKTMIEKGPAEAVDDCYFATEVEREMFRESDFPYTSYEIREISPINENLYVLTVDLTEPSHEGTEGETLTVHNFVARLDGTIYLMNNVRHVPESIEEGLERSKYEVVGEGGLDLKDLVVSE